MIPTEIHFERQLPEVFWILVQQKLRMLSTSPSPAWLAKDTGNIYGQQLATTG